MTLESINAKVIISSSQASHPFFDAAIKADFYVLDGTVTENDNLKIGSDFSNQVDECPMIGITEVGKVI